MRFILCLAVLSSFGCVELGWQMGPGMSTRDPALFAAPPVVVHAASGYSLTWTQGSQPFFFQPSYKAKAGRLVFALAATSSSGSLAGRPRVMKIEGADEVSALKQGGACWWERSSNVDGTCVTLEVVER
jgi:hypothetical protein